MSQAKFFDAGAVSDILNADIESAPADRPVMTDDWRRWIAENLLLDNSPQSIIAAMVKDGFHPLVSEQEVNTAMHSPYLAAARGVKVPTASGASSDVLAKRDWILHCYRRAALADPASATVPIVNNPTREQFLHDFYSANRPCLIEGIMDDWPARQTNQATAWTLPNLKARLGDKVIETQAGRNSDPNYELNSVKHRTEMRFGDYIDRVLTAGKTNDFYMTANNSGKNREALSELWNDIRPFPQFLRTDDPNNRGFFWFGPEGIVTPLHHDLTNNFMAQVVGRKLVKLIAPYELPAMYNSRHCYSQVDLNHIDYEKFPLFKSVRVIDVMLSPGQVLFLPVGWWHHVTGVDISITMTFTNFVFDNDFYSAYSTYGDIK